MTTPRSSSVTLKWKKLTKLKQIWSHDFNSLFGRVVNEADPEDEPDKPEGPEEVEDRFPAEGVTQEAADRQRDDGAHLKTVNISKVNRFM